MSRPCTYCEFIIASTPLLNECALNLDESIFALEGGGISPVVGVVGDGGAAAATVANANSYQFHPITK